MDLSADRDLAEDCCPTGVAEGIRHGSGPVIHLNKGLKDERCDSNYSSGYVSGNLPSDLGEGRYASDEDRLIPVAGLESLTLDNSEQSDDKKSTLVSIDEGFGDEYLSSERISKTFSSEKSRENITKDTCSEEEESEQLRQYRQLLLETFQQDDDGDT